MNIQNIFNVFSSGPGNINASLVDWPSLNVSVHGQLSVARPFAAPCFEDPAGSECQHVQNAYFMSSSPRVDFFGPYVNTQWETCASSENEKCLLNHWDPADMSNTEQCSQGSVPPYYVKVQEPSDVIETIKFARENQIPLVIRNTGHDYLGRSSRKGALALWTGKLKDMTYHEEFTPAGCSASVKKPVAVTIGAGVQWYEAYKFGYDNKVMLVGGACVTVGAVGGWLQGGGHSVLSPTLGLGVDRVVQFELITASGMHLFANECMNSDLFYALRGGGGGTYGVVLSATVMGERDTSVEAVYIEVPYEPSITEKFYRLMVDQSLDLAEAGWGTFIQTSKFTNVNWAKFGHPSISHKEASKAMAPFKKFVMENGGKFEHDTKTSFYDYVNTQLATIAIAMGIQMDVFSRLVPDAAFKESQSREELFKATLSAIESSQLNLIMGTTPYKFKSKERTSVTPAWRNSIWHLSLASVYDHNATITEKSKIYEDHSKATDVFRKLYPSTGAYLNEAEVHEPDYISSFWGDNYEELLTIKNKYDPENIFSCWKCVGWEGPKDEKYKCYI